MLYNIFRAANRLHIKIKRVGTGKEWVAMGTKCVIAVGVFSVELLACQVSMICAANWPIYLYLYTLCNIRLGVWHHQSPHLHTLCIFQTWISLELIQIFANGKRSFHSFIEFYVIKRYRSTLEESRDTFRLSMNCFWRKPAFFCNSQGLSHEEALS